eukprot:2369463-Amphidinium_carterae.2
MKEAAAITHTVLRTADCNFLKGVQEVAGAPFRAYVVPTAARPSSEKRGTFTAPRNIVHQPSK